MSIIKVQCKGSGQDARAGLNAKRALCPVCAHQQDLTGAGKFRKHMKMTRTKHLK